MGLKRRSFIFLLVVVILIVCVESKTKKWRAHIKKKSNSPKISASYHIVPPKRKIIHKHKAAPHKRHPKMNYYHSAPSSWPPTTTRHHATLSPTYYLASNYPRWRSYIVPPTRNFDFPTTTYLTSSLPTYHTAQRRSDEFDMGDGGGTLLDMGAFNSATADPLFEAELPLNREFVSPQQISMGGWTPVDYKSLMADADFSLLNGEMAMMGRQLDAGDGVIFNNGYETHFL